MSTLMEVVETYRLYNEDDVRPFIEEVKAGETEGHYLVKAYSSVHKEKKQKGEVIAEAWVVKISKSYAGLWDDLEE